MFRVPAGYGGLPIEIDHLRVAGAGKGLAEWESLMRENKIQRWAAKRKGKKTLGSIQCGRDHWIHVKLV